MCCYYKKWNKIKQETKLIRSFQGLKGKGNKEWLLMFMEVSFWSDSNVLELVAMIAQSRKYTKNHRIVHIK